MSYLFQERDHKMFISYKNLVFVLYILSFLGLDLIVSGNFYLSHIRESLSQNIRFWLKSLLDNSAIGGYPEIELVKLAFGLPLPPPP